MFPEPVRRLTESTKTYVRIVAFRSMFEPGTCRVQSSTHPTAWFRYYYYYYYYYYYVCYNLYAGYLQLHRIYLKQTIFRVYIVAAVLYL
jgi:hypothetical protein